jgi:hypothetical protein
MAVFAGLLGAITVDDGPTAEQLAVLSSIGAHYLGCTDVDVRDVDPIGPAELAVALTEPGDRRRFHHLLVALEAARHPQAAAQVESVERYARALGVDGPDLVMFRSLIDSGVEAAAADYRRFIEKMAPRRAEPTLVSEPFDPMSPEPELMTRLEAFADLDEDSLGRAFLRFYERTGLSLPGMDPAFMNHFYVAHDMTHVIAGIGTTSLPNAETETLSLDGASELLGQEMARGAKCTADFSLVDHFALAPLPLAEVRRRFGVVAPDDPDDPDDGFHIW